MRYLLLLTFVFCSRSSKSETTSQTLKSSVLNSKTPEIGKCDSLVSELVIQLEADNGSWNTTALCRKVSECYGSMEGETAKNLKKIYDFRCEKYEFYSVDMMYCFKRILQDRDWGYRNNCPNILWFTTTDLKNRRHFFEEYKSCILNITQELCSPESLTFLDTNYKHFVDFLTIAPGNDSCESLHVELNNKQCEVFKEAAINEWWLLEDYEKENGKLPMTNVLRGLKYCNRLKECHEDRCNIFSTVKQMKDYEFYNATVTNNFYSCLAASGSLHPVSMGNCSASGRVCSKKVMAEECGNETVEEFDKLFDWFNKYDLTKLGKLKIHGDFAQYEVTDTFKNTFSFGTELGKCAPLVENLVTLLSRRSMDGEKKYYRLATEKCDEIDDCFGTLNTEEAKKLKKNYQLVCEKLQLKLDHWKVKQ